MTVMDRLTKLEIQRALLGGTPISWRDAAGRLEVLQLVTPAQRRLFGFLLESTVRDPRGLTATFISGLSDAYSREDDPASGALADTEPAVSAGPWRLQRIETEGFGGVNQFRGPPFELQLDGDSFLSQGPNGSGKSSLIGAILWAMTGDRPREHYSENPAQKADVLGEENRVIAAWPPIASYPDKAKDLSADAFVRVTLVFGDHNGNTARVERQLKDGRLTFAKDPILSVPDILVETGLLMPSRLANIRFERGQTALTQAVQRLTGLDDLAEIGLLVDGLCNRGREYLSTNARELDRHKTAFNAALAEARRALEPVGEKVEAFLPKDTESGDGPLATLGKRLRTRASELTQVIAKDLSETLDLTSNRVQQEVTGVISNARDELKQGLSGLPAWRFLTNLVLALPAETAALLASAVATAEAAIEDALDLDRRAQRDTRMRLKALGAQWHEAHRGGDLETCPLCDKPLDDLALKADIESLRRSGEAATRRLADNLNAIQAQLEAAIPRAVAALLFEIATFAPRQALLSDAENRFVTRDRYRACLTGFIRLVSNALTQAPMAELVVERQTSYSEAIRIQVVNVKRALTLAQWHNENSDAWQAWWNAAANSVPVLAPSLPSDEAQASTPESLAQHLERLSDAVGDAAPYRNAADALGRAWQSGRDARKFEKEQEQREAVVAQLVPQKSLGKVAEAQARLAIDALSKDIVDILKRIHLSERLAFKGTSLQRRAGMRVHAGFSDDFKIDATLVANTSWLRAVLWAFVLALRNEAIKQLGADTLPLIVLDDPQATFDAEHRQRWAREIAGLQQSPISVQVILTTHDEVFLELAKIEGVAGREATIIAAGPELGHLGVFEGAALERGWADAQSKNTPAAAQRYISEVRVYVEGLLRLMLRGQTAGVAGATSGFVLGQSREKLHELNTAGLAPWDKSEFKHLVGKLDQGIPAIKYMEMSHHAPRVNLGMAEAIDVEQHWRKNIATALDRAFRMARDHQLLHGGLKALHAPLPTGTLPDGYSATVRSIPLQLVGRAAALTDGKVADGRLDLKLGAAAESLVLGHHLAFRLNAPTLEPVARKGDILLVKQSGEPSSRSLVVARSEARIVARRFEIAENHSDVAVLAAQAVNPKQIAPPIVAKKATLTLHKVVGVLFDPSGSSMSGNDEVSDCGGELSLSRYARAIKGVVEVAGHSAEPIALDGQLLLIGSPSSAGEALRHLEGQPVIASDADDNLYFKRLRYDGGSTVVLESLEIGGDYGPVVLSHKTGSSTDVVQLWPVHGVLFERP